jgi:hypothetical protein
MVKIKIAIVVCVLVSLCTSQEEQTGIIKVLLNETTNKCGVGFRLVNIV